MKKTKKNKKPSLPEISATGTHQWLPVDVQWDTLTRPERKATVREALRTRDVDTLWSVTEYNLRLYGRGGSHTSEHTLRAYRTGVWRFLQYAFPLGWQRMTEHDTDLTVGYLRALERTGLTPGTINARRSAARALYRALRWAGVLQADPFADTPRVADPTDPWARREAYTREDIAALMAVADPDEQLMLLLGAHGALRMSEMIGLTWDRVDLDKKRMTVTGKGRKTARVHLSGPLHAALSAVPENARTGHVLPWRNPKSVRMLLRALCTLAGVTYERRQVHGLRHAAATMLLEQTGDIYVVSRHLRHSTIGTTEIYAKMRPERLTEALDTWVE
ncbi:tyrosine-type recombinase/integrase [Deinococcus grandis]|uniref:tyrosine-type recombinase/integrase n=1 Tax=Deinococcus grandis TaxID=57498 RepID=UPI00073E5E41|nr:tyrosine-type recombinase/integrase [Deinococcus grandis]